MSVVAFVEKINSKSGTSKKGKPYTLYSMKLSDKEGNELPGWYQCAFDNPAEYCKEGDYIKADVTPNGSNFDVNMKSIKVAKNGPAKPASKGAGTSAGTATAKVKESDLFGQIGGYNTEDDIRRMSYSAARHDALAAVALLIDNDALKFVKADTKAGAASRFDLITDCIDKLTVEYFYDSATGRKLETVADAGTFDASGDGDLPDADEVDFDDDEPVQAEGDDFDFE